MRGMYPVLTSLNFFKFYYIPPLHEVLFSLLSTHFSALGTNNTFFLAVNSQIFSKISYGDCLPTDHCQL